MKRVVIVGGGYAGTMLARALDAAFDVVLIEPREAFVHNVAAIRALVEPGLVERIILPYGRLLRRGKVIQERVEAVAEDGVTLGSGRQISGDYVVLATGSTYAQPFKPVTDAMADFRAASAAGHAAIRAARSITVVGAGAVGVEAAGEIASSFRDKEVALVSSTTSLFPGYAPRLGARLAADLRAMGVVLKMGVTAEGLTTADRPQEGPLRLATGEIIKTDLVIPALGARPDARLLANLPTARFDSIGRVEVDGWMRPAGFERVFALGDVAANGDLMTIVASSRQAPWLAKALTALAAGGAVEDLPAYRPWASPPILVPLGPRRGASVLPLGRTGAVTGRLVTRAIKGKSLFIPRYHKDFGVQAS